MASVFTKIISGEFPCYKIYEDDKVLSFLALDQVNLGHTLVICKEEINHWTEVPADTYAHLHKVSQKIGKAILKASGSPRVGQMVAGFEVPHYHLHLIPAWSIPDLDFKKATRRSDDEMKKIQQEIIKNLA
ncbi:MULTISPECIES: HIT family protein [unclassified Bdellovibrio]|uniref:HIT family protein n=1 Tax=unclassified Bdellovibrio TaxID=2633795 RepID=UPI00115A3C3B|nr:MULTISPECIES: HIT family protein [unclassified Bdellovibrio]QDK44106.1 HIT family protein [Bdellovibrio sp. ZAP7]QLY25949.1 HIT family protein [Bdellovibrio sp. KM01]